MAEPLTKADLAEALDCFWNAAIGAAHREQAGMSFASIMAEGLAAVAERLRELETPRSGSDASSEGEHQ